MMLILILNWLFNGLLLSIIYFLVLPCLINDPYSFFYNPPEWCIWALGVASVWILILISFTRLGYYLLRLFSQQRRPTKEEMQILHPFLIEIIQNTNAVKGTHFQLSKLRVLVSDVPDFQSRALASNIISISSLFFNATSSKEIKAVLACELAHLYYKDSLVCGAVLFGSMPSRLLAKIYTQYVQITNFATKVFANFKIGGISVLLALLVIPFIVFLPLIILSWLGDKLFDYSLRSMTRRYVSRAYKFASELGYSTQLIEPVY